MASFERAELDEWVQSWLRANKECEKAGDWKPLGDFYAPDATYGWNIGPKEDVMCVGIDEIRDFVAAAGWQKEEGHKIGQADFVRPAKTMSQIGG